MVVHVFMFAEDLSLGLRFLKFQIDWFATTGEGEPFLSVPIPLSLQTALRLQISFLGAFPTTKPEVKL